MQSAAHAIAIYATFALPPIVCVIMTCDPMWDFLQGRDKYDFCRRR